MGDNEREHFERMIIVSSFTLLMILAMTAAGRPIEGLLAGVLALGLAAWWGDQRATRPRKEVRERLAFRLLDADAGPTKAPAAPAIDESSRAA